jgi:hypothetical protein
MSISIEKTELMKKYETETGLKSVQVVGDHWVNEETVTDEYAEWLEREYERAVSRFDELGRIHCSIKADQNKKIRELEVKASSYDRLLAKKLTDEELDSPPASKILKEMAEKAEAYDRLMSMNSVSENEIRIVLDGNAWCAYRMPFRNLQEDDAGFGSTPQMALTALLEVELPDGRDANHDNN